MISPTSTRTIGKKSAETNVVRVTGGQPADIHQVEALANGTVHSPVAILRSDFPQADLPDAARGEE